MAAWQRRLGDGLAVLGGARPDLLEAVPGARPRFVALGGVLLSTGGLAGGSMAFAVGLAPGGWWPGPLPVGLGWGFVRGNLGRVVLGGLGPHAAGGPQRALAVPPA